MFVVEIDVAITKSGNVGRNRREKFDVSHSHCDSASLPPSDDPAQHNVAELRTPELQAPSVRTRASEQGEGVLTTPEEVLKSPASEVRVSLWVGTETRPQKSSQR